MSRIFINYRRNDTKAAAGRLYEWLSERYGEECVFMDVDAIVPGEDWEKAIDQAVGSTDLVIAVIGDKWLSELNQRLTQENDFVRHELEAALQKDKRIIPVLVDGVQMPSPGELPASLAPLTRRHAFDFKDERFLFDKQELMKRVDVVLGIKPAPQQAPPQADAAPPPTQQPPAQQAPEEQPPVWTPPPPPAADSDAALEAELAKWNWGAFLLGPIWGIGHGVWRSLLTLVPIYGLYEWVMLGMKGNRWAWEARRWESVARFRKSQRKWAGWGIAIDIVVILIVIGSSSGSS